MLSFECIKNEKSVYFLLTSANRCISLLLFTTFYMPAWNLGTIWAPFTEKAP